MTTERAQELQEQIAKEAIALLIICGAATDTTAYEQAIILTGEAWSLSPDHTTGQLELIAREKEAILSAADPKQIQDVLPESDLPMNASGMETLSNIWGLFETAVRLEKLKQREILFSLANELAESQNLLDWIEKTPAEKKLPELAVN